MKASLKGLKAFFKRGPKDFFVKATKKSIEAFKKSTTKTLTVIEENAVANICKLTHKAFHDKLEAFDVNADLTVKFLDDFLTNGAISDC